MYKLIFCLSLLPYFSVAQCTWFLEGEVACGLLTRVFEGVQPNENVPDVPPLPFTGDVGVSLYKKINTKFCIGLGLHYQLDRNGSYLITYSSDGINSSSYDTGYLSSWNYLNVPLSLRYNINTRWFTALQLSNAFLVSKSEQFITKRNGSIVTRQERFANITSNERFHALGLSVGYSIPLKKGNNLLIKAFYDYVILSSTPTSAENQAIPNQYGIGLVYQIPNLFQRKVK